MLHAVSDGFTVSSTGVAVGMTVPEERQAGAQGVLGGAQALAAGIMAVVTGPRADRPPDEPDLAMTELDQMPGRESSVGSIRKGAPTTFPSIESSTPIVTTRSLAS